MHLVYSCLEGAEAPEVLPTALVPPNKRALAAQMAEERGVVPDNAPASATTTPAGPWVVPPSEKVAYDRFFSAADKGKTGLVTGQQVMRIFMSSQLDRDTLAHVWCVWPGWPSERGGLGG